MVAKKGFRVKCWEKGKEIGKNVNDLDVATDPKPREKNKVESIGQD
jgi:hypothetical protein